MCGPHFQIVRCGDNGRLIGPAMSSSGKDKDALLITRLVAVRKHDECLPD